MTTRGKTPKSPEDQAADSIYARIMDNNGHLKSGENNPQLHIVVALLNIDVNDLIERKVEYFKTEGISLDVAKVRWEYHRGKRRIKLFQIDNALNGNTEGVFMSNGLNMNNMHAMHNFTMHKTKQGPAPLDHDAEKLFESLTHKSQFVSPGLKQHLQLASPGKFRSLANLNASPEPLNLPQVANNNYFQKNKASYFRRNDIQRNLKTAGGMGNGSMALQPNQTLGGTTQFHNRNSNSLSSSIPDFNHDVLREMNREKEKLNRFLEIKESSVNRAAADIAQKKRQQDEKEKKIKKKQDQDKKEWKMKVKKYAELNEARVNKLAARDRDVKEQINESRTQYKQHLNEIKVKREQQMNQERAIAMEDYKRQQKRITSQTHRSDNGSPSGQKPTTAQQYGSVRDYEVEDQLKQYENKFKQSTYLNQQVLQQRIQNASNVNHITKLGNIQEARQKQDLDQLGQFMSTIQSREQQALRFQKMRSKTMKTKQTKRDEHLSAVKQNIKSNKMDTRELNNEINQKHKNADKNLNEFNKERQKQIMLNQEKKNLKALDAQKNLERQKWAKEQQKMKIMEKHMKITDNVKSMKDGRAHLMEYSRIANELRIQKSVETSMIK